MGKVCTKCGADISNRGRAAKYCYSCFYNKYSQKKREDNEYRSRATSPFHRHFIGVDQAYVLFAAYILKTIVAEYKQALKRQKRKPCKANANEVLKLEKELKGEFVGKIAIIPDFGDIAISKARAEVLGDNEYIRDDFIDRLYFDYPCAIAKTKKSKRINRRI